MRRDRRFLGQSQKHEGPGHFDRALASRNVVPRLPGCGLCCDARRTRHVDVAASPPRTPQAGRQRLRCRATARLGTVQHHPARQDDRASTYPVILLIEMGATWLYHGLVSDDCCPADREDAAERYCLGHMSSDEAARFDRHVSMCERCAAVVEREARLFRLIRKVLGGPEGRA